MNRPMSGLSSGSPMPWRTARRMRGSWSVIARRSVFRLPLLYHPFAEAPEREDGGRLWDEAMALVEAVLLSADEPLPARRIDLPQSPDLAPTSTFGERGGTERGLEPSPSHGLAPEEVITTGTSPSPERGGPLGEKA